MICVRVPATSANIGPGFDCLGMALCLYNRIYFQESGEGLRINGCDRMYSGEDNLSYLAYLRTLEKYGIDTGDNFVEIKDPHAAWKQVK